MANYTFSTTVPQERALTWIVARYNANSANPGAPNVTNLQYLRVRVDHQLDNLVADLRNARRAEMEQKYEDATPAVKASVNAALDYEE